MAATAAFLVAAGLVANPHDALAATITVNTTADDFVPDALCSLREAIEAADSDAPVDACPAGSGTDTIIVPAGIYPIGDPLEINSSLTISGAGAGSTVLNGGGDRRVLVVSAGVVTLEQLTVTNGFENGSAGGGILVEAAATLTISDSVVSDNTVSGNAGGGLFNRGTLVVIRSSFTGNNAENGGGGIFNNAAGPLAATVTDSTFVGNTARSGGGIGTNAGTVTVTRSTISGNTAVGANPAGGGLSNSGADLVVVDSTIADNQVIDGIGGGVASFLGGTLTIMRSALLDNHANGAAGRGGGLYHDGNGAATVTNSTFSGNTGRTGGGLFHNGGAVLTITSSTIAFNSAFAADGGGGIRAVGAVGLTHTIVASNTPQNCVGTIIDNGFNLEFPAPGTCGIPIGDPRLGPLQFNGGPTMTFALLPGSAAIDTGAAACPAADEGVDQRGFPRPRGAACDIGAFEVQPPVGGDDDDDDDDGGDDDDGDEKRRATIQTRAVPTSGSPRGAFRDRVLIPNNQARGWVTFYLCKPGQVTKAGCPKGKGTKIGPTKRIIADHALFSAEAKGNITKTPGVYCWRIQYSGDKNFRAAHHTNRTTECFTVKKS